VVKLHNYLLFNVPLNNASHASTCLIVYSVLDLICFDVCDYTGLRGMFWMHY